MRKKILIVDDEPEVVKFLVLRLRKKGFEVLIARDGEKALAIIRRETPDLILLDVKLPKLNGYEVLKRIRQDDGMSAIPVIFSTADASVNVASQSRELNANGYLLKPFEADELFGQINKCLN